MLSLLVTGSTRQPGAQPERYHSATSIRNQALPELFAFHSNFWLNLHHFLYVSARAQKGLDATRAAVASVLSDTTGLGALPVSDQNEWRSALAYYGSALANRD